MPILIPIYEQLQASSNFFQSPAPPSCSARQTCELAAFVVIELDAGHCFMWTVSGGNTAFGRSALIHGIEE
jgi:hypothetical protein